MDLLFTKGVKGKTDDQFNISLYSESNFKNTNLKFDVTGLSKIKKEYGVQLIGVKSELNKDIRFTVFNNDNIIDVEGSFYELDNKFVALMDNIEDTILGDEYFDCIYNMPFFIITEGLEAELFMSRDEFSKCISKLPSQLNNTMLNKVLYTNELIAMVKDIQNYTFTIYHNLIKAGEELSKIPESAFRQYNINPKESVYEYRVRSSQSNVISSLYMSIIIQLSSILDLISKLTCEIINMPKDYDKLIKFKSGSIYFSNIGRFSDILKKYNGFKGSIINNRKDYDNLILNRNLIVHNGFLSSISYIFLGKGTDIVNKKEISYAQIYIWDNDDTNKPARYKNRTKFYSQKNSIDEYVLNYILKFYFEIGKTLDMLNDYIKTR